MVNDKLTNSLKISVYNAVKNVRLIRSTLPHNIKVSLINKIFNHIDPVIIASYIQHCDPSEVPLI